MGSLFDRVLAGEETATAELQRILRDFARQICRGGGPPGAPEIDWEDVAQECSRKLLAGGLQRFRGGGSERSYLYTVVKITVLEMARMAERRRRREGSSAPPDSVLPTDASVSMDVRNLLAALDPDCREVIERVVLEEEPYSRVAHDLGLAESSVRARLSRCIRRAREIASQESAP